MPVIFLTYVYIRLSWSRTETRRQCLPKWNQLDWGLSLDSRQHMLTSWARRLSVATSRLCWLKSQHRWLMNMKRLFNVKSLWFFFFQMNSFRALQAVSKSIWAKEKGHFNQNTKFPCLIPFPWVPSQSLKYMFVDPGLVLFVWGREAKEWF